MNAANRTSDMGTQTGGDFLRFREDRRTLAFISTYFLLLILAWVLNPSLWGALAFMTALSTMAWIGAVITHNTVHCPIFRRKRLNKAFQVVLTLTYGHPVSTFVPGHNLSHHKFVQTPRDVMRTTKVRFKWNLLNILLFFFTIAPAILKGEQAFIKTMRKSNPAWSRQLLIEAGFLIGISAALLVLDWQLFLIYWFFPHFMAGWGIVSINYLQHDGCDVNHPVNHSRNFTGKFFGWWTFNNGYHGMHHEIPGLHWSLLPKAHAERFSPTIHPNLEQKSFFLYIVRTFGWPAKRLAYDDTPYQLPKKSTDENWVPAPGHRLQDVSYGAEA
jgi:fatty acid desaturase